MANHFIGFYHLVKFILWIIKLLLCMNFLPCCEFPNILIDVVSMAAESKVNSSIFEQNYDDTKYNALYSFQTSFKMLSLFYLCIFSKFKLPNWRRGLYIFTCIVTYISLLLVYNEYFWNQN